MIDLVRAFHEQAGLPVAPAPIARPPGWELRVDLLREEFGEYAAAAAAGDLAGVADGLADMAYAIYGTALTYGIPLDDVIAEAHRVRMSTLDSAPESPLDSTPDPDPDRAGGGAPTTVAEVPVPYQRLAAYAVLRSGSGSDGELLLTRISPRGHHQGAWTLPGGGVDHGEDPRVAVRREVTEETGLDITVDALLDSHSVRLQGRSPAGRLEDFHGVHLLYAATITSTDRAPQVMEVDGTTDAVAWIPIAAIRSGDLPVLDVVTHLLDLL